MMRRLGVFVLLSVLAAAGCGGAQSGAALPASGGAPAVRPAHGGSWMMPEAKNETLLYVPNVYNVTVYNYATQKLVGTIDNFSNPYGSCSDSKGNVFITDSKFARIYEYAHAGTKPIRVLKDPDFEPYGCAVDPVTGNLAVANYEDASAREGNVAIYRRARGYPVSYSAYSFYYYYWCTYDSKGNLYIDGSYYYGQGFLFAELPKGKHAFVGLDETKQPSFPGGMQWDGKYVDILDPTASAVYQFSVANHLATLEGTVSISGASYLNGFYIAGSTMLVPNQANSGSSVLFYKYPAGGSPAKTLTNGVYYPFSVTLSPAGSR